MKIIKIPLPKIGESTTEAKIVEWLKQPGDFIKKDEIFAVIGTDKVDSEIFSEYEGKLVEILVQAGEEVEVGKPIATMEVENIDSVNVHEVSHQETKQGNQTIQNSSSSISLVPKTDDKNFLSPLVRKMALENKLTLEDLQKIQGTGENGRLRKQDVERFLSSKKSTKSISEDKIQLKVEVGESLQPLSKMRKLIAENMEKSWRNIPHVTTFIDVNVSRLVKYRENQKEKFQQDFGVKLTYTHLIMQEIVKALQTFPQLNAWFNGEEFLPKNQVNLGFATALLDGNLIVPNIKNAGTLSLSQLAIGVSEVGNRAKSGKLTADDIQNTTFTVSNTGMFGSKMGTPIITQPQVAVLALGNILRQPWVVLENEEEKLAIQDIMTLSISYDHRVIDGALASKFLTEIKKNIETHY